LQGVGFFAFYKTLNLSHWVLSGGAGWPGRGSRFSGSRIFPTARATQEARKVAWLYRHLFVGTQRQKARRLVWADRSGQPEPPGSTRCTMPSTSHTPQAWRFLSLVLTT